MNLRLIGEVVGDDAAFVYRYFGMNVCCPADVRAALDELPDGEELVLEINSPGGSVTAGMEIYSMIRNSGRSVQANVYGQASSIMTMVTCACDPVMMSPVAVMMIHRASTAAKGNSSDMREAKQMLDTIDESILAAYELKCGDKSTRDQLKSWMRNETFFTARDAVAAGLADGILFEELEAVASAGSLLPPVEKLISLMADAEAAAVNDAQIEEVHEPAEAPDGNTDAEEREAMEITNTTELREAFPEQVAQIEAEAASAERIRISEIHALNMNGCEDLIEAAVNDPAQNAGTVAVAIIARQKEQGQNYLAMRAADAKAAEDVHGAAAPEGKADPEAQAKASVKDDVELWKKNRDSLMGGAK